MDAETLRREAHNMEQAELIRNQQDLQRRLVLVRHPLHRHRPHFCKGKVHRRQTDGLTCDPSCSYKTTCNDPPR